MLHTFHIDLVRYKGGLVQRNPPFTDDKEVGSAFAL
jgi:hypothetical protein